MPYILNIFWFKDSIVEYNMFYIWNVGKNKSFIESSSMSYPVVEWSISSGVF